MPRRPGCRSGKLRTFLFSTAVRRLGIAGATCGLACGGVHAAAPPLYPIDQAISKGVVNARISLFSASDREHVLGSMGGSIPG